MVPGGVAEEPRRHRCGARVGAGRAGAAGAADRAGEGRGRRAGARRAIARRRCCSIARLRRAARARPGVRPPHLPRDPRRLGPAPAGRAADAAPMRRTNCASRSRAPKAPTGTRRRCSTSPSRAGRSPSRRTGPSGRCSRPCSKGHVDRAMLPIENTTAGSVYEARPAAPVQPRARRRRDRRRAALPARRGRRAARVAAPHSFAPAGAVAVQRVPGRRCATAKA